MCVCSRDVDSGENTFTYERDFKFKSSFVTKWYPVKVILFSTDGVAGEKGGEGLRLRPTGPI